jgi:hypothetical protein
MVYIVISFIIACFCFPLCVWPAYYFKASTVKALLASIGLYIALVIAFHLIFFIWLLIDKQPGSGDLIMIFIVTIPVSFMGTSIVFIESLIINKFKKYLSRSFVLISSTIPILLGVILLYLNVSFT